MTDLQKLRIDRSRGTRRRRGVPGGLGLWIVVLAGVVAAVIFWPRLAQLVDRVRLPAVDVARVERSSPAAIGAVTGKASANGYVVAARRAALSADTPGRIVELNVTEGSVVKKGDVVARLYSEEYEAALKRAEVLVRVARASVDRAEADLRAARSDRKQLLDGLAAAQAEVEEAEASHRHASAELKRTESLLPDGIATRQELDERRRDVDESSARLRATQARHLAAEAAVSAAEQREAVAQSALEVAEVQVEAEEAARDQARATLDKTEVRAPFDGVVVLKDAEVGEVVSPNSQGGSNARGSVCTMVDFASLEVQADVPETSLPAVEVGAPARIQLDAYPDRLYSGRVSRIWPTANRQKATIEVRIRFDEPDERLRPEMGVLVKFLEDDAPPAVEAAEAEAESPLLVPVAALLRSEDREGVFVLERDRVRFRPVKKGAVQGGRVAIEEGLLEGERVVIDPPPSLEDEDRVRVRES